MNQPHTDSITTPTSTRSVRPRRGLAALAVAVVALAACGGDNTPSGAGASDAAPRTFCGAVVRAVDASSLTDDVESLGRITDEWRAVRELTPDDAPDEFAALVRDVLVVAENGAALEEQDVDAEVVSEVLDASSRLFDLPVEPIEAYLGATCDDEVRSGALEELFAAPDGSRDTTVGSAATGATGAAGATTTSTSTTTTTTIPVVTSSLTHDSPAATELFTTLSVVDVTATNAELESYFGDDPVADQTSHVLIEVLAETTEFSNRFEGGDFKLIGPDGRPTGGEAVLDGRGVRQGAIGLESREADSFIIQFDVDRPPSSLDGWTLALDRGSTVPALMPLVGPVDDPYPIVLDAGASTQITQASLVGGCPLVPYRVDVTEATVELDVFNGFGLYRAPRGERFARVTVDIVNLDTADKGGCELGAGIFDYEWRLAADGRPTASTNATEVFASLERGATRQMILTFTFDATVTELELLGEQGEVIGSWTVELPPVDGS